MIGFLVLLSSSFLTWWSIRGEFNSRKGVVLVVVVCALAGLCGWSYYTADNEIVVDSFSIALCLVISIWSADRKEWTPKRSWALPALVLAVVLARRILVLVVK